MAYRRKKGGQRLMELAGIDLASRNAALKKKRARQRALRIFKGTSKAIDKAKLPSKVIRHGKTKITVNGKSSPHLTSTGKKAIKPLDTKPAKTSAKKISKLLKKKKAERREPKSAYAKLLKADWDKKFASGTGGAIGGGTISARKTGLKARLGAMKHHVLQEVVPATGRALERFEEDLGSIAHAVGLRKSDKPIRIANVPSSKKSATGLDVLTTLGGLGLSPVKKVTQLVTPARMIAEKAGPVKKTLSKIVPKEVKKFYQKHIGSRLSPKMQITPTRSGTSLGTTTEITTRGLAFGAGTGASKVNKKIRSEAEKIVARINKARTGRTGKKNPLTVAEFLKAAFNVKPKIVPKARRLKHTPPDKPRVFNMPTTAKPKSKATKKLSAFEKASRANKAKKTRAQTEADRIAAVEQNKALATPKPKSAFENPPPRTGKERPMPTGKLAKSKTPAKPPAKKKSPVKKTSAKKTSAKKTSGKKKTKGKGGKK